MIWEYDEDGCFKKGEDAKLQFWLNKPKGGAYLDWRISYQGEVYGGQMLFNIQEHADALWEGSLTEDVIGFLDSIVEGCNNQVALKLGAETQELDLSEDLESNAFEPVETQ